MNGKKVYLTLQNGRVFEGKRFGACGDVTGELVFTTGMTGYIETLTVTGLLNDQVSPLTARLSFPGEEETAPVNTFTTTASVTLAFTSCMNSPRRAS